MTAAEPFVSYLAAWNETDPARIRGHLERSVSDDVVFVDPHSDIRGVDAVEALILAFRKKYPPSTRLMRTSVVDRHHDRARYGWAIDVDGAVKFTGLDAVELDAAGRLSRIDGFFGPLKPHEGA